MTTISEAIGEIGQMAFTTAEGLSRTDLKNLQGGICGTS
jgi:hypothetical protein